MFMIVWVLSFPFVPFNSLSGPTGITNTSSDSRCPCPVPVFMGIIISDYYNLTKVESLYSTLDICHPASLECSLRVTAYYLMNLLASFLPSSIWELPPSLISIPFILTQSLCFPAVSPSRDAPLLAETQLWKEAPHPTLPSPHSNFGREWFS